MDIMATIEYAIGNEWPIISLDGLSAKAVTDTHIAFCRAAAMIADQPHQLMLVSLGLTAWIIPVLPDGSVGTAADAEDARVMVRKIQHFLVQFASAQADDNEDALVSDDLSYADVPPPVSRSARAVIAAVCKRGADRWQVRDSFGSTTTTLFAGEVRPAPRKERVSLGRRYLAGGVEGIDVENAYMSVQSDSGERWKVRVNGEGAKGLLRTMMRIREISVAAMEYLQGDERYYELDVKNLRRALNQPEELV